MAKRGRKKGSRNRFKGMPDNFYYWRSVVGDKQVNDFLARGDERQKRLIKHTLEYVMKHEPDYFEEIEGAKILRKLKV